MASKYARLLWEQGISLNQALLDFAPPNLANKVAETPRFLEAIAQSPLSKDVMELGKSLTRALGSSQRRAELEGEIKEWLLTELFNGELIATGYREAPSISQSPVVIDPDKFDDPELDWRRETLTAHGIRYGRIKITSPKITQNPYLKATGSISVIDAAIEKLKSSDPQFSKGSRKLDCQKVRNYLQANHDAGYGLSDINISKAIVRICGSKRINYNKI